MDATGSNIWQGKHIRLRAIEPSDWQTFHEWNLDSDTARFGYELHFPQSEEAAREWARREATRHHDGDEARWVIQGPDGSMAGTINTYSCSRRNGSFSYGVALRGEHRQKGYAAEAILLVLRYFFRELRYHKVTAHVYSFNEPSIRLHEKLGFVCEGRLREVLYTQGHYADEFLYGMTDAEFEQKHGQGIG